MTGGNAIEIAHLTKTYKLYRKPSDRLREALGFSKQKRYTELNALNDVSFDVKKGETVGIIGTNGSGKSTILKIITGVLTETSGSVEVDGRISALLELGAGFNQEYTGIENVYLNGTMIGFTKEEIDAKLQGILDFADIGDFVNQPVKTYSSGMFVRLAFAVAINIDPEILIVDEALSVGDVFFQAKCYHKFEEFKKEGKTILFVSHDLSSIAKYCDRVVLLNKGVKMAEGRPKEIVDLYKKLLVNLADEGNGNGSADAGRSGAAAAGDVAGNASAGAAGNVAGAGNTVDAPGAGNAAGNASVGVAADAGNTANTGNTADAGNTAGTGNTAKAGNTAGSGNTANAGNAAGSGNAANAGNAAGSGSGMSGSGKLESGAAVRRLTGPLPMNPHTLEYGEGQAKIIEVVTADETGRLTNAIDKGERFEIRMKVRFFEDVESPIFAYTFKNLQGTEITGTNTMFEDCGVERVKAGEIVRIVFRQRMTLQGGEYLLSFGCTGYRAGDFRVFHRLYDVLNVTCVSTKNTVGFYDMESEVAVEKETE